jgi:DNA ligase D-like protein (predicted 3'-phosphoesterase)
MPKKSVFVVQKHHARMLHYDLRIEIDGVLKSWSVPKGPSMNPKDKRLAILVDDHDMEYADFEGEIEEGEYGAGTVEIWDKGNYSNIQNKKNITMNDSFNNGHIEVKLDGKKLHGNFAVIRMKKSDGKNWLLIKMKE